MTNVSNYYIDSKNKLISDKESYIIGNKYRFTILTPRMIRLEYSINGVFEDRPTSLVINRSFPKVPYSITESNTLIQIDTGIFTLSYVKDSDFKSTTFGSNIKAAFGTAVYKSICLSRRKNDRILSDIKKIKAFPLKCPGKRQKAIYFALVSQ